MDIFGRFARDPSCLVALDAADGGSWRSPFRPGLVYPAAVPRNFAAEPATWYDFRVAALSLGTHDWQFEIDFLATESVTTSSLWHVSGYINAVNIYIVNSNYYNITLCKDGVVGNNTSTIFRPSEHGGYGRHKIRVVKIGSTATVYINGVVAGTFSGFGQYWISAPPSTLFNSTILGASLTDLTLQKTSWQYPSFEERSRLITKSNVWTQNGIFEAASSPTAWNIKYAGTAPTGDYTAVIDTTDAVIAQVRKSGAVTTYTNAVSGGTLPYLTLGTSTLSGTYGTKMRHFLLFDRALRQAEIQLLR